ncbi:terminase large subunit [Rhodobacter phage RcSimone-Hastad]|jgi:hypothetical protein|nr:terminase large subunit [Rhodobacter phage RcSimone-Hastad]
MAALPGNVERVWSPQAGSQELFLSCPIFECLYEGTRGPGKTDALLMDFLQHVGTGLGPDWRGILFRRSHPELADVIAKSQKWFKRIFPGAEYNKVEKTWTFPDGEQLLLRHIKVVEDYNSYHGHAYPWIGWEELTNWADDAVFRKMFSCCRSSNPRVPRKVRATCNPYGVGHNWVKRRYRLPSHRGVVIRDAVDSEGELEPPRVAIHGHIYENRILLDADPNYISRLRASARNPAELKAWLKGDWDIVAGGMLDDVWNPKVHVLDPFPIPSSWRVDRSFDWGSSRPFAVGWWAESDGTTVELPNGRKLHTVRGDLFRIAEWYGANPKEHNTGLRMTAANVALGIREREAKMLASGLIKRLVSPGPADNAIWDSEPGHPSIAADMQAKGVHWERSDKSPGSRKQGWLQMRKLLEDAQKSAPREQPGMFIFRTCHHWLDLVPVLPRDDKDLDDVDTDAEDHLGDETRYRVRAARKNLKQGGF